jgi:glycosyltransferase involved in cell wall biosynthesis
MARIALNARLLIADRLEGIGWFTHECYKRIIDAHPEHEFRLIFDRPPHPEFEYGDHANAVRLWPPARRPFLYDWWFDYSIARELRRWNADAFVSTDGMLCRRTKVSQLAVFHDLNFMHHPEWMPEREADYYRSRFPEFAQLAAGIVTVSEYSKRDIMEQFGLRDAKIQVVPNAPATTYRPEAKHFEMDALPDLPDDGYFIFVGSLHPRKNLQGLLTAFQNYRQRGGSLDLVIVGEHMWKGDNQRLEGTRFLGRLNRDVLPTVVARAHALVFVPWFEGFGVPIVEAFASGVPVIASQTTSMPEVCGGAEAALVDPGNPVAIADAMWRLEHDAEFHAASVARGLSRAQDFNWDASADKLWMAIESILPA